MLCTRPPHAADQRKRTPIDLLLMPVVAAYFVLYYTVGYFVLLFVAVPLWAIERIVSGPARMRGEEPRRLKSKTAVDAWLDRHFEDPI